MANVWPLKSGASTLRKIPTAIALTSHDDMKKVILFLMLLTAGASTLVPSTEAQPRIDSVRIDALFSAWDAEDSPGVALAIAYDGQVLYERGYGMANLDHRIPVTPETVFMVASVSKQFTNWAIAHLALSGKLDLDADIRTYVPEMQIEDHVLTTRHLIHHTSGLRDEFDLLGMAGYKMDDVITHDAILALAFRQRQLNYAPGEQYSYSNTGYTLMALMVERLTNMTFRAYLDSIAFAPLAMTQSHVQDDYLEITPGAAQGYARDENGRWIKQINAYESLGASGLFTTVGDLTKWLHNLDTGAVGGQAVVDLMHTQGRLNNGDTLNYAFGISISDYEGHKHVRHTGWHRGFRTYAGRFPDDKLSLVVLGNGEQFESYDHAMRVADLLLGVAPAALSDYTGTYYSEEIDTAYEIAYVDGRLRVTHDRNDPFYLQHDSGETFTTDAWYFESLTFERDASGVSGFLGNTTRAVDVRFEKRR
jgi:CubicO group peptidase (beta-lactamase class C family)